MSATTGAAPAPGGDDPLSGSDPTGADAAAFDRLFEAYFDRLRRFAYRYLRSWEEAEDVVHDVFVRLWARRDQLSSIADLEAYLYTAARNRAMGRLKHLAVAERWRAQEAASTGGEPATDRGSAQRRLERAETAAAIQRALDSLSPRQRDVILLQWRGKSYEEIGAVLGISPKTVSVHISRAFDALREILRPLLE